MRSLFCHLSKIKALSKYMDERAGVGCWGDIIFVKFSFHHAKLQRKSSLAIVILSPEIQDVQQKAEHFRQPSFVQEL